MWGGWYEDKDYMKFMADAMKITKDSQDLSAESVAELAVFVDENSLSKTPDKEITANVIGGSRRSIGLIGTPKDYYLSSDFDLVKDKYKAYISLVSTETDASRRIRDYAKANDKGIMEITPKNFNITPEELRAFCKDNDVFIYSNKNAVIYANESYIFIHTGESGEQNLAIPDECKLTDVFSGEEFSSKFTANIGKSYLLKKHKI